MSLKNKGVFSLWKAFISYERNFIRQMSFYYYFLEIID